MATQLHRAETAAVQPKTVRHFKYGSKGFSFSTRQLPRLNSFGLFRQTARC